MKTGIYGGTFNPIHNGHLHIVEEFRRGLGLDRVLLIPTRVPPHKAAPDLASAGERFAMCRLAAQGKPWLELSDIEMRREGKSYTAETLEELSALYPQDQFYLLMGEDMFLTLGRWYRPETIFSLASVCTTPRSPDGLDALRQKALEYTGQFQARCFLEHIPYLPISSTQVRQAVARGEDVSGLVPQAVAAYTYVLYNNQKGVSPWVAYNSSVSSSVSRAVESVLGEVITYNGQPINATYCASNAGQSNDSASVWGGYLPYLVSVDSPGDTTLRAYGATKRFSEEEVAELIEDYCNVDPYDYDPEDWFSNPSYINGKYVNNIRVCGQKVTGRNVREGIMQSKIASSAFEVEYDGSGYGHGVGMSQQGADWYAMKGWDYVDILTHYYTGVRIQ